MSMTDGAPAPEEGGGPGGPPGGGPDADQGGLLATLQRQQQGPAPSAPGEGTQANAMTQVQNAVMLLKQAHLGLDPAHPLHNSVGKAITALTKHAAQGQPGAGAQMTQMQDIMRMIGRTSMLQQLRQRMGGGGGGGRGGGPPMPSAPLPGS